MISIDLDALFAETHEALDGINAAMIKETGKLAPLAILFSISDGEDPKFEGLPEGEVAKFTIILSELMGRDKTAMVIELMRGIQYNQSGNDVLPSDVEEGVYHLISTHPEGPEVGAQSFLDLLTQQTGYTEKDVVVFGVKRMIRDVDAFGAVLSLDSRYRKIELEEGEELDLSKIDLANDAKAMDAIVLHFQSPDSGKILTKPYKIVDGEIVYAEESEDHTITGDAVKNSRFGSLFEPIGAVN
jgi:hypothetical protein